MATESGGRVLWGELYPPPQIHMLKSVYSVYLLWREGRYRGNQVKMRSSVGTLVQYGLLSGASHNNLPANVGHIRDIGLIPGLGIPWRRAWQPTQYSCLENPMDREAWQATVNSAAKSQT